MISTMASGFTRPFVGTRDILMLNSVCDIAGLNTITREVFRNGAIAIAAMAREYEAVVAAARPLVLMSTLSTTDKCSVRIREALTAEGYEVMVFHTLGNGGMTLDDIVRERDVAAVVDLSLVEINDFLQGGLCSAGRRACPPCSRRATSISWSPARSSRRGCSFPASATTCTTPP
jgi:uncharacterized protein (UPF0261 family)